jgi:DNA polymerase III epsilon subunit family exonuclease
LFAIVLEMHLQTSLAELGTPLAGVTFCVVDLETTGGSPHEAAITEIGAMKVKHGEAVGTFQTLVNPGRPVPAFIRLLTGLTDSALADAPPVGAALPSFLEFARGCVLVAHNARFDVGFLNHALDAHGYPKLEHKVVDTAILARKILAGETPNNKLETLAKYLRCAHQPNHRAFQDVLATVDVLHHLIERVAGFGVTTLEDLLAISRTRMDGSFKKLVLTDNLPQSPGVYRFIGHRGKVLYVGKATDIRSRVRSYFYGDPRRKIRDLLRETEGIRYEIHKTLLEAEVAEARSIARDQPPYNRSGKKNSKWYLKIDVRAKTPRAHTARTVKDDGAVYLGPLPSSKLATLFLDALRDAGPLHRCSQPAKCGGCAFSEMGTCVGEEKDRHRSEVRRAARGGTQHGPGPARRQDVAASCWRTVRRSSRPARSRRTPRTLSLQMPGSSCIGRGRRCGGSRGQPDPLDPLWSARRRSYHRSRRADATAGRTIARCRLRTIELAGAPHSRQPERGSRDPLVPRARRVRAADRLLRAAVGHAHRG